jgi:hypothetical protein
VIAATTKAVPRARAWPRTVLFEAAASTARSIASPATLAQSQGDLFAWVSSPTPLASSLAPTNLMSADRSPSPLTSLSFRGASNAATPKPTLSQPSASPKRWLESANCCLVANIAVSCMDSPNRESLT